MIRLLVVSSFVTQSIAFIQHFNKFPIFQLLRQPALNARTYPTEDLDTAYEWLAQDLHSQDPNSIPISWFHPADLEHRETNPFHLENVEINYQAKLTKMPLYPCGAVHVPFTSGNYTFNNIQERNVNMANVSAYIFLHAEMLVQQ
jgi:hypothetical protein